MKMRFLPGLSRFSMIILFLAVCISSCTTAKKLRYFQDLPDSDIVDLPPAPQEERQIEFGDQLDISFSGKDPEAALFFTRKGVPGRAWPDRRSTGIYRISDARQT
jgi:polysaccharide biosynthesis/export protein